jgi:hypothetical protein
MLRQLPLLVVHIISGLELLTVPISMQMTRDPEPPEVSQRYCMVTHLLIYQIFKTVQQRFPVKIEGIEIKKNYKAIRLMGMHPVFGSHGTVCCVVHRVKFTEGDIHLQGREPEGSRPRQSAPALLVAE